MKKNCVICDEVFVSPYKNKKYCGEECKYEKYKRNYKYESKRTFINKTCLICNKVYLSWLHNQKYCSYDCGKIKWDSNYQKVAAKGEIYSKKTIKKWGINKKIKCLHCEKKFIKKHMTQKYCTKECRNGYNTIVQHLKYKPIRYKKTAICEFCKKQFEKLVYHKIYCSKKCCIKSTKLKQIELNKQKQKAENLKKQEQLYEIKSKTSKYFTIFNQLRFYTEHDFENWFKNNYTIFGIKKLIKINRWFPDVVAEMYNGKVLRIELELLARNFKSHGHDPLRCDLILCFAKTKHEETVKGVPVISIFETTMLSGSNYFNYNEDKLILSEFMLNLIDGLHNNIKEFITLTNIKYPSKDYVMAQISRIM